MKDFKEIEVKDDSFFLVYPLYNEMTRDELNSNFNEIYGKLYQDIKLALEAKGLAFTSLRAVDKYKLTKDEIKEMLAKSTGIIIPRLDAKEDDVLKECLEGYTKDIYEF